MYLMHIVLVQKLKYAHGERQNILYCQAYTKLFLWDLTNTFSILHLI